ncbi:MAG: dehypoxanthine futalosine cyclase [Desulfobulbaceae bacterium]|nr:MAG: dehypoxanthine futalosine cyclase [Desulfobulbaceae bacterium]
MEHRADQLFDQQYSNLINAKRLTDDEFIGLYHSLDLVSLGGLANLVRQQKHDHKIVTYVIDRNINYTDICISACKFCAFYKGPEHTQGSVLSKDELLEKIDQTKALGGTQILLQGGLHPDLPLSFYETMVRDIKRTGMHLHGFSPPEICHFASISGFSIDKVLDRLIEAGLDSIPGGGAEILCDRVRTLTAPNKCSADQWIAVMEMAHKKGLRTTATMMFGHVETIEERLEHLRRLRELQDKTGGFTAFIPWPFQSDNTPLRTEETNQKFRTTGYEYLRMLALSRIYLDNFDNIQASWVTQGPKVAQLSLMFGANDFGSTMIEENVVAAAGVSFLLSEDEIKRLIEDAGMIPRQRRMDYSLI